MLIYVIDAFNLFHAIPEIAGSAAPHADLIAFLKGGHFTGSPTNRVVLVFDGFPESAVEGEREYELRFSKNRTADDCIREFVAKAAHPRQVVVVSDDRAVRDAARAQGAACLSNREFLAKGYRATVCPTEKLSEPIDDTARDRITKELEKLWLKK